MTTTALQWVSTKRLCEQLCIGRSYLFDMKSHGMFTAGTHFRQNGTGKAPLAWDLAAVDQTLRQLARNEEEPQG